LIRGGEVVTKKILAAFVIATAATIGGACNQTETTNANANANTEVVATRTAPDDSEITTTTDASGVKTETRVFKNNPRISRVVVTTRNGNRTVKAYSRTGEEKEINDVGDALQATGDAIASSAGWVGDKAEDVAGETKEGAVKVGEKTVDTAEKVGQKTAAGAKKVGEKTVEGAKKAGQKVKDVIKP
jgi:hypothetical protein